MLEKDIEKLFSKLAKSAGWTVKLTNTGIKGVPDRVLLVNGEVFFIELKTEKGALSPIQKHMLKKIKEHGGNTFTLYGSEEVKNFFKKLDKKQAF